MGEDMNRRHTIDAMKAMDPTDSGKVTFQMFRNWLVDTRDGRHWTDFLVLAEGQVQAIRDLAYDTEEFCQLEQAGTGQSESRCARVETPFNLAQDDGSNNISVGRAGIDVRTTERTCGSEAAFEGVQGNSCRQCEGDSG